jgi:hypothetical protein
VHVRGQGPTNGGGGRGRASRVSRRGCALELRPEEREVLRRACRHYRNVVPSYLTSRQEEVRILDRLLRQLA